MAILNHRLSLLFTLSALLAGTYGCSQRFGLSAQDVGDLGSSLPDPNDGGVPVVEVPPGDNGGDDVVKDPTNPGDDVVKDPTLPGSNDQPPEVVTPDGRHYCKQKKSCDNDDERSLYRDRHRGDDNQRQSSENSLNKNVLICHVPPGNPDARHTIMISVQGWLNGHERHHALDHLGACDHEPDDTVTDAPEYKKCDEPEND